MGLGKTLQMIAFVDCFLRHTKGEKVLIIVPVNTLQNWAHEFDQWVPSKGRYIRAKRNAERRRQRQKDGKTVKR